MYCICVCFVVALVVGGFVVAFVAGGIDFVDLYCFSVLLFIGRLTVAGC